LIAAEHDIRMSSADFGIGMIVLTAGIILATSEIWWKAIAEASRTKRNQKRSRRGTLPRSTRAR